MNDLDTKAKRSARDATSASKKNSFPRPRPPPSILEVLDNWSAKFWPPHYMPRLQNAGKPWWRDIRSCRKPWRDIRCWSNPWRNTRCWSNPWQGLAVKNVFFPITYTFRQETSYIGKVIIQLYIYFPSDNKLVIELIIIQLFIVSQPCFSVISHKLYYFTLTLKTYFCKYNDV